jgi:hypothetical protein
MSLALTVPTVARYLKFPNQPNSENCCPNQHYYKQKWPEGGEILNQLNHNITLLSQPEQIK